MLKALFLAFFGWLSITPPVELKPPNSSLEQPIIEVTHKDTLEATNTPISYFHANNEASTAIDVPEIATTSPDSCSCVRTARKLNPNIPLVDADKIPANGGPIIGGAILFSYPKNDHVAIIKEFLPEGFLVYEGNFKPCKIDTRIVNYNDKFIRGFFR